MSKVLIYLLIVIIFNVISFYLSRGDHIKRFVLAASDKKSKKNGKIQYWLLNEPGYLWMNNNTVKPVLTATSE
jgi:hypothetical protein